MEMQKMTPSSSPEPQASQAQQEPDVQQQQEVAEIDQKPKEIDQFEQKFAALSKKQKAIFEKEKELQEKERKIREIEERESLFDKNPIEYFEKRGKSIDEILRLAAGDEKEPESRIEALEKKIAEYERAERERAEKQKEEEESRKQKETIEKYKSEIKLKVEADKDRWEAICETDSFDEVFDVIFNYFQTHGEEPPFEWAADEVEKALVEQARKFTALKKLGLKPTQDELDETPQTDTSEQKTPVPTITNNLRPEPQANNNKRLLSDEESKAQVAKLLRWS